MKITTVLTFIAIFQLSATTLHSQSAKVNISRNSLPLKEFIREVEKQTDYLFMYSEKEIDLKQQVGVNAKDKPVSEVLKEAFANSAIEYNFNEGYISLRKVNTAVAQQSDKKIIGVVKDANGETIIGANVMVKGTTLGNITDIDGRFTLNVPEKATLVVSYIGYLSQEIAIGNKTDLSIVLKEDTEVLDEVVVIGYGTTSTRKLASAVTSIKGEKLQNLSFNDMTSTLQGRASGVIVQNQGGEPGSTSAKVSIRGGGDPVYVIDGVISTAWEFNTLNSVDIESLSVLKDAASLAVYGSRAADGIILVKTKQGTKGKTAITYTFNAEYNQPTKLTQLLDAYTYADTQNKAAMYDGLPAFHQYSEEEMDKILNQTDPLYPDVDWADLALKNFAPEYRHTLSVNGSGKLVNYYLSLGMIDQGSIFTANTLNYDRYTIRSNVNTTFDKIGLTVGLNLNGAIEKKDRPYIGGWGHVYSNIALTPAYNEDGTYSSATDHGLVDLDERSGYNKTSKKYINTQLVADWVLPWVTGLSLGTMLNYRVSDGYTKAFNNRAPQFYPEGSPYPVAKPTLKENAEFKESYNFEVSASYMNTFNNDHTIDAKAVFTVAENTGNNFWTSRKEFLSSAVDQMFAGSPVGILNDGNGEEGGRMGVVGRLKYDYKNRYIIEGSFRYDGSDNFAQGYRWGFFPSGAVAWALSEEPFFKKLNWKSVDLIKLRASYGQTGTENGVNRFGYIPVYDLDKNIIVVGGNLQSGFSEGKLVSPDLLSWYTRNSLNYGIDMAFLDNRLKSTVDYFFYVTKGGLMSPGDRYTTPLGKDLPQIKSNSEQRREGIEFSLRWGDKTGKDFTYDLGFNMIYFNNLWKIKADESMPDLMNPWKRTTNQTDFYDVRYISQGYYQTVEQILNSPRRPQSSELKFGDIAYQDINGDGKIDDQDQTRTGNTSMPHFTYGFDFSFGYKGFSLSGLLYGTGKRNMELATPYKSSKIFYKSQLDYWTEENRDAEFPRITTEASRNGDNNIQKSDFWLKDASFIRLKNLQLSYDLKYSVLKNTSWLSMCRVNLSGANLFTISGINKFYDPETPNINNEGNIYATDGSVYPVQRVVSFGLTVGF